MLCHSDVFFFTANYLVWPILFQVMMVDRRLCGSVNTCWCLGLLSRPPGSPHFTFIIWIVSDIMSMQIVNGDFVVLFYLCNIYCVSVDPGRGIPPLWLFLRVLPSLTLLKVNFFLFSLYGRYFLTRRGLRIEGSASFTLQLVKPTEAMWFWFWPI